MARRKTGGQRWMALRCDASMQSPTSYGRNAYGVEPPPAPDGKARCPVCWKAIKLMQRVGFGGRRIPAHNQDQEMLQQKEALLAAAESAAWAAKMKT